MAEPKIDPQMSFFVKEVAGVEGDGIRDARDAGFALSLIQQNVNGMNQTASAKERLRRAEVLVLVDALRKYVAETVPARTPEGS